MKNDMKTVLIMLNQIKFILTRRQKIHAFLVLIVILIGAGFETLGVTAIIPFVSAMLTPEVLLQNKYVKILTDIFHIKTTIQLVILMGVGIILIYLIKNVYLTFSMYVQTVFQCRLQKELSVTLLQSYMCRPYTFFLNVNSADILRGIQNDINGVYTLVSQGFKLISEVLTSILIGVFIISTDPIMASGILLFAILCLVAVTNIFRKWLSCMGIKQREYVSLTYQSAYQAIVGIKEVIAMHREQYFAKEYEEMYDKQMATNISYTFANACPERIIEAVCISGLIGVVCFRLSFGSEAASMIPQLGAFAVAAFRILPSIARIVSNLNTIVFFRTTLESTANNLVEVKAYKQSKSDYNQNHISSKEKMENIQHGLQHQVQIQQVWWRYPNSKEYVLSGLEMTIQKGESVAFIGSSGAGKTTLADILLGLLQPERGDVQVDGVDIFTIPEIWAKTIGYVPQSVFLIDDTIRNNVTFGISKEESDDEMVWKALEQAQLKEFVKRLPKGLDTVVGERGVKFSGGQRQRVAIARALYYDPDILVLDEATSALDTETETAVMESIDALQGHKTLIIVAHRLTTIRNCDRIYEIIDGKAILRTKEDVFEKD